jgi:thiamine biosynthesis protein ThiC
MEYREQCRYLNNRRRGRKISFPCRWGADDYGFINRKKDHETREWIIRNSPVPIEQCLFTALEKVNGVAEDLTWEVFVIILIEQAEQGVSIYYSRWSFIALHSLNCGTCNGIVSRGGSIMAKWCLFHHKEKLSTPILKDLRNHETVRRIFSLEMVYARVLLPMLMMQHSSLELEP